MGGALRKLVPEAARIMAAMRAYGGGPLSTAGRYLDLYRRRRFSPDEIHFFRLLDPSLSARELAGVVSKEELLAVQRRLNPSDLHVLTEDKIRFHQYCLEHGLEVPAIYALFSPHGGAGGGIPLIRDRTGLTQWLRTLAADACIVKPVNGVHGEGVTRLMRRGSGWQTERSEVVDASSILDAIESSHYDRWMFQELVHGHPDLCRLSDTNALQTVRVVTFVDADANVTILAARLRLICGDTVHDNFDYGKSGNLIANLDLERGTIVSAVGGAGNDPEICYVDRHPGTGKMLIGYAVPQWAAVSELVTAAARAFMPLRTVGWDVAITPTRPCLIEGNVTWDTLSGEPRMGEIYRVLQSAGATGRSRKAECLKAASSE